MQASFPPIFFDIMVHLTVHLVQEIHYLGPSYLHQRYMGILKSFVNNRKYPEGNNISRYGTEEAVQWSMTYLDPDNPIGVPHSRHEGRLDGVGTLGKKSMNPEQKIYDQAHFLVLEHIKVVELYVLEHKYLLVQQNPRRVEGWVAKKHMKEFNN